MEFYELLESGRKNDGTNATHKQQKHGRSKLGKGEEPAGAGDSAINVLDVMAECEVSNTKVTSKQQDRKRKKKTKCKKTKRKQNESSRAVANSVHQSHGQLKSRKGKEPASADASDSAVDVLAECKMDAVKGNTNSGRSKPKHTRRKNRKKRAGCDLIKSISDNSTLTDKQESNYLQNRRVVEMRMAGGKMICNKVKHLVPGNAVEKLERKPGKFFCRTIDIAKFRDYVATRAERSQMFLSEFYKNTMAMHATSGY
ncbi:hypothetical protein GGI26_002804 [Coemansia sp. RSA 1358]|nr:hypothetical protein GGI26_002804 [Coemansia sp. RSA 1358]